VNTETNFSIVRLAIIEMLRRLLANKTRIHFDSLMSNTKPKVFISSTIYDLRDLRSSLKYWLKAFGYEVYLSEYSDFPTDSDRNSYECCFQVIDQCDYFILLIGNRIGGWFSEPERISITQEEYRRAYGKMMNDDSIKIISFVRKEIWDIREDRKELKKHLQDTAQFESITDDQKRSITNHPSKFVEDAEFIFSFLKEVGRHDEMKQSIQNDIPLPKGNWIYPFYEFEDIVRSLESVFGVGSNLNQKRALFLLRDEVITNLSALCESDRGEVLPKFHWAHGAYQRKQGDLEDQTPMKVSEFKHLFIFTILNNHRGTSNHFIKKSILDGSFLAYDNSTHAYVETSLHRALMKLNTFLEQIEFSISHSRNSEEFAKMYVIHNGLRQYPDSKIVPIDNMRLISPFGSYLMQKNAVLILKVLLKYIDGNENALDFYEEQLVSTQPFSSPEDTKRDESLKPTTSQIEDWVQLETKMTN